MKRTNRNKEKTEVYKEKREPDRSIERKRRQRRFERDRRAAGKERLDSKTKGRGLTVLGQDDSWLRPRDLRKLKDAPDEMQYRDG